MFRSKYHHHHKRKLQNADDKKIFAVVFEKSNQKKKLYFKTLVLDFAEVTNPTGLLMSEVQSGSVSDTLAYEMSRNTFMLI